MSGIEKLFDLLDDWRHLPAYQTVHLYAAVIPQFCY